MQGARRTTPVCAQQIGGFRASPQFCSSTSFLWRDSTPCTLSDHVLPFVIASLRSQSSAQSPVGQIGRDAGYGFSSQCNCAGGTSTLSLTYNPHWSISIRKMSNTPHVSTPTRGIVDECTSVSTELQCVSCFGGCKGAY